MVGYRCLDKLEEACGIFGVYSRDEDVARLTYFGLHGLQHRGQESAGIAVGDGKSINMHRAMGLVPQVFDEAVLTNLQGHAAIGHVRYSTTGSTRIENAQPMRKSYPDGSIAVAHNGNLTNTQELRSRLAGDGATFQSTCDSEVIASLVAARAGEGIETAIKECLPQLRGAFSVVLLSEDALFAFRDVHGIRPLALGRMGDTYIVSSETCGLDIIGATYEREVEPGELIIVDKDGLRSVSVSHSAKRALCIFEFIYFARPDSFLYDRNLYFARKQMGMKLAEEAPVEADLVIGVPDSGTPAAIGFAERSGIPYGEGLIKNRYIGRTFIQPGQTLRQLGIRLKLNPLKEAICGKRLVVIDDSIVRGNTSRKIVTVLKEAGAEEVHLRISSPPVSFPCFYGIDTADQDELIAAAKTAGDNEALEGGVPESNGDTVEAVREYLGADTLHYLSLKALVESTGRPDSGFCMACFSGDYPIKVSSGLKVAKFSLEEVKL